LQSVEVRAEIVRSLELDLVGPPNDHAFAHELLPESPTRWYLTGALVPIGASLEQRIDETSDDEIASGGEASNGDDDGGSEKQAARKSILPSSMGLSVLVAPGVDEIEATVEWGDYAEEGSEEGEAEEHTDGHSHAGQDSLGGPPVALEAAQGGVASGKAAGPGEASRRRAWRRTPRQAKAKIAIPASGGKPAGIMLAGHGGVNGVQLVVTVRPVSASAMSTGRLPKGTRSVSVFVVNRREPDEEHPFRAFVFQTKLTLESPVPFVPRPDLRGAEATESDDWDDRVADLQYRDVCEYAVGHGVSATWQRPPETAASGSQSNSCRKLETTWIPRAEVELVAPSAIPQVELQMEVLGKLADGADAAAKLQPLVTQYRQWIESQKAKHTGLTAERAQTASEMMIVAGAIAGRIEAGIELLADPQVREAFCVANRAMARAGRQRAWAASDRQTPPEKLAPPSWRPFQLAFFLMTLRSIAQPMHNDRKCVDLLFFPTGGGKTEAYLGLAAFSMALRRLQNPGVMGCGMSVLMRYTLRLLTLDQLGRAAALMCALELERETNKALGEWPFEIGLWVGMAATPNRMGKRGDSGPGHEYTAYTKLMRYQRDDRGNPAPIPIEECPWCATKFTKKSFRLVPSELNPMDLRVHCVNHACAFTGNRYLPILGVDEPIYRRLPAFLIATVDKFASLPWTGETGCLFGLVNRYDKDGFYGPCSPGRGVSLGGQLPPPDLIIQDELHLISGPLGTIAGVYEAAIDALATRQTPTGNLRPKIIASTATVRRADVQIRALFERLQVSVFPPPGPDRRDSFFAHTVPASTTPARLYIGVAAQGRSLKVVLLRTALALLSAGQVAYERENGKRNEANPADPYMTLLGYFNSLRELGGSRRIIEDEVRTRVAQYSRRRRIEPPEALFTNRSIEYDVLELTSRVSTSDVSAAKHGLSQPFHKENRVDTALATNMISVGLDIIRLGLMVVLGQPKTSAEYIQATSRVGRDPKRPGLVVTLLNVHKPRDRSHYERFETYHDSFYRSVEATSVTPFSPRALDRALAATLVAMCRHTRPMLTVPAGASLILAERPHLDAIAKQLAERARNHAWPPSPDAGQKLHDHVLHRCTSLLDDWVNIAQEFKSTNVSLQYGTEMPSGRQLLFQFLDPALAGEKLVRQRFRANRSMRDVEPSVDLTIKNLHEWGNHP
jgi:hypothetical protein